VQLAFDTRELRDVCERSEVADAELGPEVALSLRRRLADLSAASSVLDLPAGNPRLEDRDGATRLVLSLAGGLQLVWAHNHPQKAWHGVELVAWRQVSRLRLLAIEDTK
jgi:hypothetical protein